MTMPDRDARRESHIPLGRYWDEIVTGGPATPDDLDPALAETIRRLHAMAESPTPDAARERVWRSLPGTSRTFEQESMMHYPLPLPKHWPSANGYAPTAPPPVARYRPWVERVRVPSFARALSQAVTALLVVLTLLGIFAVVRLATPGNQADTLVPEVPMFRGDAARTGIMPGPGPAGMPTPLWTFTARDPLNNATVVGGVVYTASNGSIVYAIDAATGTERWRFDLGGTPETNINSVPAVNGGLVYVGSATGTVFALDAATGVERWRVATGGPVRASPAVVDGVVYVGSADGNVYALGAATGEVRWSAATSPITVSSPAVGDGSLFVGSEGGTLHALDLATGAERWRVEGVGNQRTPAVVDGTVYAGSEGGYLVALDAADGAERWRFVQPDGAIVLNPAVANGLVYVTTVDSGLYALDATTGTERWHVPGIPGFSSVVVAGETAFVGSGDGGVVAVDVASGTERFRLATGPVASSVTVAGNTLYVTSLDNTLTGFGDGPDRPAQIAAGDAVDPADGTPTPATAAGTQGTTAAEFVWQAEGGPEGIQSFFVAVAPDGTVWANDSPKGRFQIFSADGEYLETWAPEGVPADSDLLVAFDRAGNIYILNQYLVHKYAPDRTPLATWGGQGNGDGQFQNATGIGFDAAGNVYVCDEFRHDIQTFDTNGTFLAKRGGFAPGEAQFLAPGALAVDAVGNAYFVDGANGRVQVIAPDGALLRSFGEGRIRTPSGVAIDDWGNVYVSPERPSEVQVFDATGQFLTSFAVRVPGEDQLLSGGGIALDGAGNVYFADYVGRRIVKFHLLPPLAPEATPAT